MQHFPGCGIDMLRIRLKKIGSAWLEQTLSLHIIAALETLFL
jgi:hypothetical protein